MRYPITNDQLLNLYNEVFEDAAEDPTSKVGKAHLKALKAVYEKGWLDRTERYEKRGK